MENPVF